jgi:YfiH family protein
LETVKSSVLSALPGIEHGFGTRHSRLVQDSMASLKQIHSNVVLDAAAGVGCAGEGDALIARVPGVTVSIRTADCLPILLADPARQVVAAVHAGWRGTAAQIVRAAIEKMGSEPASLHAAIGPGIGACCYEVGPEVAAQFGIEGVVHLDLAAENRRQLIAAGVPDRQIDIIALCTRCRADLFHSWRRDGPAAGRMVSYIRHQPS